jgi:hypothetical protein
MTTIDISASEPQKPTNPTQPGQNPQQNQGNPKPANDKPGQQQQQK